MDRLSTSTLIAVLVLLKTGAGDVQSVVAQTSTGGQSIGTVAAPPSVDNGVANGVVKRSGSPSVGDGRANGVVKSGSSPSVGNGIANGVVKPSTAQQ